MRLWQLLVCKFNLMKIREMLISQEKLRLREIEEIHNKGRITSDEKAHEWEKAGICAPLEYMGEVKRLSRCNYYSNDCHQCLRDFASYKKSYEPYSNAFDVIPDFSIDDDNDLILEYKKRQKIYDNKGLVKRR